jgi:hypothetical protein
LKVGRKTNNRIIFLKIILNKILVLNFKYHKIELDEIEEEMKKKKN